MSQIGTFFRKIRLFEATIFGMAPRADSDDEAAFLDSAQDAGVLVENLHRACRWFFRAKARLTPAKTWKHVLQSRENRKKQFIGVASVIITIACCSDFPINHADLPELLEITFAGDIARKTAAQPTIHKASDYSMLDETTTMPSDTSKRLRVDFCGSSEEADCENHERANTWFCRVKVRLSAGRNFADVLKQSLPTPLRRGPPLLQAASIERATTEPSRQSSVKTVGAARLVRRRCAESRPRMIKKNFSTKIHFFSTSI